MVAITEAVAFATVCPVSVSIVVESAVTIDMPVGIGVTCVVVVVVAAPRVDWVCFVREESNKP